MTGCCVLFMIGAAMIVWGTRPITITSGLLVVAVALNILVRL